MSKTKTTAAPQLDEMICFSVYAAGLAFNRLYQKLLRQFGLSYPQFIALVALQQHGPLKVGQLGAALFLESNTLTPLLKRLEAEGFLTRKRSSEDERVVQVALSGKGEKLVRDLGCVPPQVLAATGLKLPQATAFTAQMNSLSAAIRAAQI